jgi:hypothetical protein
MSPVTGTTYVPGADVARTRQRIEHPVVDADGHLLEFLPLVFDFVREEAGEGVRDRLLRFNRERFRNAEGFVPVRVFHGLPAENTLDRMTVTLPRLLYERLDEIGIDFSLLYPSFALTLLAHPDDEVRQAGARALNRYYAEVFDGFRDRLEPVAVIPTFTPDEAIAAPGSTPCSPPTSATGTFPTRPASCPRRGNWSSTASSTRARSVPSPSATPPGC